MTITSINQNQNGINQDGINQRGPGSERYATGRGRHPSEGPAPLDHDIVGMLRILGEAHFWPHAREAGDLSSDGGIRIALRGRGSWVYDAAGRPFLDTLSGMWLANIGHGRDEMARAVFEQMCELSYAPEGTVSPVTIQLAYRIAALAPDPESRIFFVSGGSEAVETALKMAKKFHRNNGEPGRFKFIWPQRVRWIVASQVVSVAGGGVVPSTPLDLREVTLLSLDDHGGDLELEVLECGRSAVDIITFATTHPTATEVVSMLREWCALGVPMLLFVDTNSSSLHGPTASIGDLGVSPHGGAASKAKQSPVSEV